MISVRKTRAVIGYALRDMAQEKVVTFFSAALFTAMMLPVLLLFIAKFGVVSAMSDRIASNPRSTELTVIGEPSLSPALAAEIAKLSEAGFVALAPRRLTATHRFRKTAPERGSSVEIDLLPTKKGDPVFDPDMPSPTGFDEIALSEAAAKALGAVQGDQVAVTLARTRSDGKREVQRPAFTVVAIASRTRWPRLTVFVSEKLGKAIEEYMEFEVDPKPGWPDALAAPDAAWATARIYARTIREAPTLSAALARMGITTDVREGDIDDLLRLEKGLDSLFEIVLAVAAFGFASAAFLIQWVGVERKRREIALMMLGGFRRRSLSAFPLTQTLATVLIGAILTVALAAAAHPTLSAFVAVHAEGQSLKYPPFFTLAGLFIAACLIAVIGCLGAMQRLAFINVSEVLRDD